MLNWIKSCVHRAVSPTLCVSYSHTVLSRFTIKGVSTVTSSSTKAAGIQCLAVLEFKWCIAICDGGGGAVCKPLIWTCGICRTPAIVPPYDDQWCAPTCPGWRGNVHVVIWFWNAFGTGLCNENPKRKYKRIKTNTNTKRDKKKIKKKFGTNMLSANNLQRNLMR